MATVTCYIGHLQEEFQEKILLHHREGIPEPVRKRSSFRFQIWPVPAEPAIQQQRVCYLVKYAAECFLQKTNCVEPSIIE